MTSLHRKAPTRPAERNLPLRLCEVLEQEYAIIHGHQDRAPTWLIESGQVDATRVIELLRNPSLSALPVAAATVRAKLEAQGISFATERTIDAPLGQSICDALNAALLADEPLYDPQLLPDSSTRQLAGVLARHSPEVRLRANRERARQTAPIAPNEAEADALGADEHTLVNRLLLEDIFPPGAIARVDDVRLGRLFRDVHALRGPDGIASALCLSGGGVRSASFALGVLQSLARAGLLAKFDYMSTVSGGGYIGSWLSTWIHRHPKGLPGVVEELRQRAPPEVGNVRPKLSPEAGALRFLRSYSHFLNARSGLFSIDTWAWIGIYLRNLTLNWLVIIPLLLLVISMPRLYAALVYSSEFAHGNAFPALMWIATLAALLTLICVTVNRPSISDPAKAGEATPVAMRPKNARGALRERFKRQPWILAFGVAPLLLFAAIVSLLVWNYRGKAPFTVALIMQWLAAASPWEWPAVLAYVGVEHLVIWGELVILISWIAATLLGPNRDWKKRLTELLAMLVAGIFTWSLVDQLAEHAVRISRDADEVMHL